MLVQEFSRNEVKDVCVVARWINPRSTHMRKLILIVTAAAAVGFTIPVITSAQAEEGKIVIKSGDRGEHRGWNRGHRKVVVIKRDHDRGYHRGWRNQRAEGSKVIIRRHRDRD
jgi:hypothetical protein